MKKSIDHKQKPLIRFLMDRVYLSTILLCFGLVFACHETDHTVSEKGEEDIVTDMMDEKAGEQAGGEDNTFMAGIMEVSPEEPWIEIGTGFRRYEMLTEGQEVPIIAGIQGGFHVWGGFIGKGFDDLDVRIIYTLELNGEPLASADYLEFELPKNNRGEFEYAGVSVIYFNNEDVEITSGYEMVLKLRVETQDGLHLSDEQTLVPRCCE